MNKDEFRTARKSLKLGQLELAAILDLSRNAISNYETGKTPIPRVVEMALAHIEKPSTCPHNVTYRRGGICMACGAEITALAKPDALDARPCSKCETNRLDCGHETPATTETE